MTTHGAGATFDTRPPHATLPIHLMILMQNNEQLTTLAAINRLVVALEERFPLHNDSFAYICRMCEETGELVEALESLAGYAQTPDTDASTHMLQEAQDVLRMTLGIARVYELDDEYTAELETYTYDDEFTLDRAPALLARAAGQLARAVNHAENTGIKATKSMVRPEESVRLAATEMVALIAAIVGNYRAYDAFDQTVADAYQRFKDNGYIK